MLVRCQTCGFVVVGGTVFVAGAKLKASRGRGHREDNPDQSAAVCLTWLSEVTHRWRTVLPAGVRPEDGPRAEALSSFNHKAAAALFQHESSCSEHKHQTRYPDRAVPTGFQEAGRVDSSPGGRLTA